MICSSARKKNCLGERKNLYHVALNQPNGFLSVLCTLLHTALQVFTYEYLLQLSNLPIFYPFVLVHGLHISRDTVILICQEVNGPAILHFIRIK